MPMPQWWVMFVSTSMFIFCCDAVASANDDGWHRAARVKRQYYDDNYYGSYYGWQAGRIVGWLIGFLVLMLIICVPFRKDPANLRWSE
uniref:Secreted protein n=1 Tax=Globodera pallida TaxID=36090 RepID=A0A183CCW8_GLOPA